MRKIKFDDTIFEGINKMEVSLQKKHTFHVAEKPYNFIFIAESDTTHTEKIRHKKKPIY